MAKYNYVYITTNLINGHQYIGDRSCNCVPGKDNYLGSGDLYKTKEREYGKKNFRKEILEIFSSREESFKAQEKYIKQYNTLVPNGYNISPTGGHGINGVNLSENTKRKISESHKGKKLSEKHKKNLSESHKGIHYENRVLNMSGELNGFFGKKHSNESKIKMRNSLNGRISPRKGIKLSEETKQKIRISHLGKNHSEETKQRMSIAQKNMSEETKKKIGESSRGRTPMKNHVHSKETKQKMSNARIGKKVSEETKQRMSVAKKNMSEETKKKNK